MYRTTAQRKPTRLLDDNNEKVERMGRPADIYFSTPFLMHNPRSSLSFFDVGQ